MRNEETVVARKTRVFVSYSRADLTFADELAVGLEMHDFEALIDRHAIAAGEDWQKRLGGLILAADTVVFVVSPDSVASDICAWEVAESERLSKRILPVLGRPVDFSDRVPRGLRQRNAIRMDGSRAISGLRELVSALDTDLEWLREHTRLAERAAQWHAADRADERLLRGKELAEAKAWLDRKPRSAPDPTDLQHAYIATSEDSETAREGAERKRLEEMAVAQTERAKALQSAEAALKGQAQARRQRAKLRNIGLALISIVATIAVWQAWRAEGQKVQAEYLRLTATWKVLAFEAPRQKEQAADDDLAALLARQAFLVRKRLTGQPSHLIDYSFYDTISLTNPFRHVLRGHVAAVLSVAFTPDGERLVSGSWDRTIRVWQLRRPSATPLVLSSLPGGVWTISVSPDGKRLAAGYDDGTVHLFNLIRPQVAPLVLRGHLAAVQAVAFSPDGKKLASASLDGSVRIWDAEEESAQPLILSDADSHPVWSIAFSPDGLVLASGTDDGKIHIWEMQQPSTAVITLTGHHDAVRSLAFSPDSQRLASGSADETIRVWDWINPRSDPDVLIGHQGKVLSVGFSPDGRKLASGGDDAVIRIWELSEPRATPIELRTGSHAAVRSVVFSRDGGRLASASEDTTIRIWEIRLPQTTHISIGDIQGAVHAVAFSQDGTTFAAGGADKTLRIWDTRQPQAAPLALTGHAGAIWSLAFSPDGRMLASGSADRTIRIWNMREPQTLPLVLIGHEGAVWSVAFSPDGQMLASGSADQTIRVWNLSRPQSVPLVLRNVPSDVRSQAPERPCFSPILLAERKADVYSVAFSSDSRRLISGGADQNVRIWDLSNFGAAKVLTGHQDFVCAVTVSQDGHTLASASGDNSIRLWHLDHLDAAPVVLIGHSDDVLALALSPDGQELASGSADKTIRIWDLMQPEAYPVVLVGHKGRVLSIAFSPNGQNLASAGDDGSIRIWEQTSALASMVCQLVWRNLSMDEWRQFVGDGIPYERTCPNLPFGEGAPTEARTTGD
jgi:WD40 repeat protein